MNARPVIAFLGFGEAAQAFVEGFADRPPGRLIGYDRKTDTPEARDAKIADFAAAGVQVMETGAQAVALADIVISLVTADQSALVAHTASDAMRPGTWFFDLNSVAPATKAAAAASIGRAGGLYVDVAVMAPVRPALLSVPMLVSADQGENAAVERLAALGFNARLIPGGVGRASAVKMIRSIMIKGLEALTAECILSAYAAGVQDEVLASLDASFPGFHWATRADYNLDRMIIHGRRRAAEIAESADTARALGLGGDMAAAAMGWQQRIGALDLPLPPTLPEKVSAVLAALAKDRS